MILKKEICFRDMVYQRWSLCYICIQKCRLLLSNTALFNTRNILKRIICSNHTDHATVALLNPNSLIYFESVSSFSNQWSCDQTVLQLNRFLGVFCCYLAVPLFICSEVIFVRALITVLRFLRL